MARVFTPAEQKFLNHGCADLTAAALVASGVRPSRRLVDYFGKLDTLLQRAKDKFDLLHQAEIRVAEGLFRWLWVTKPIRYQSGGAFRLHHVLDAQLDPWQMSVGNCLGLTVLYNSLAQRAGLLAKAVYLPQGPHVISRLFLKGITLDIDNSVPYGFGCAGLLNEPQRLSWGNQELVAELYTSVGNEHLNKGEPRESLSYYRKASALDPKHPCTALNTGIAMAELGHKEEAEAMLQSDVPSAFKPQAEGPPAKGPSPGAVG